jgi:Protein of unknown function (DUF2474)
LSGRTRSALRIWCKRIGWLVAIWAASVIALGIVAGVLHIAMRAAALSE